MTSTELKSLLYEYLAILRFPGGAEKIGFAIESHIARLDLLEGVCRGGHVHLRDLPAYRESTERGEYRETGGCPKCTGEVLSETGGDRSDSPI